MSKGKANKQKGKRVEREIADLFSQETGLSWQRVPNSGAFIGGQNVNRIQNLSENQILLARGDLIPPDEFSGVVIECKGRVDFSFNLLFEKSTDLDSWIKQALIDYEVSNGKFLAVIFKVNRKGYYVAYKKGQLHSSVLRNGLDYLYEPEEEGSRAEWYRIEKFDDRWIKNYKLQIKQLCNRK
jgi:hypothetical protein